MSRRAFSLLELVVVVAIMGLFSGAMWHVFRGGVRQLATAGDHQVALRNALVLTTALDHDLRAVAVLNQRREYQQPYPLSPQSIVFSPARTSMRLRVSAPIESLDADPASRFLLVTYQLVESGTKPGMYALRREERTASGSQLPGDRTSLRSHTFEDLTLAGLRFRFVAWLGPLEWRQFITLHLAATEGQTPQGQPRTHSITRQFDIPVPPPPHGSAGGPRGFALDFPPSALAGKLSGGMDIVARPGNLEPLEAPPDALDRRGQPVTLPPEAPPGPVSDPFARLELPAPPLKSLFLHAALDRLEGVLGAGYRGAICGHITGTGPVQLPAGAADLRFRLDASESCLKPLIQQIDGLFEKAKLRGPAGMLQLANRFQMEAIPGSDKPPLEAARLLIEERRTGN